VARHARAKRVDVEIIAAGDVCLRVIDDGVGPPGEGQQMGNGLRNMATRAGELGGAMAILEGPDGGTVLEWRIPRS
jgi:signal transduction histidine kinase